MHKTHYQPKRSQHLLLVQLYKEKYGLRSEQEQIVVHHVLEDTTTRLYLQIERRCPRYGIDFIRIDL